MENMTIDELYLRVRDKVEDRKTLDSIYGEYNEELVVFARKLQDFQERILSVK